MFENSKGFQIPNNILGLIGEDIPALHNPDALVTPDASVTPVGSSVTVAPPQATPSSIAVT
jgi:hypothetical protein